MSLYSKIKSLSSEGNLKKLFSELKLTEGYELLQKLKCTPSEMVLVAKYTSEAYDSDSPLHEVNKTRTNLKKSIFRDYGLNEESKFWKGIINNENEDYNNFVSWYYTQIQDYYFEAILTCQEVLEEQMGAARMKIGKYRMDDLEIGENGIKEAATQSKMDDDKYLKAMNIQNTCLTNAIENIKKLKELKDTRLKQFERTDDAIKEEIFNNSGEAEQQMIIAKFLRKK